MPTKKPTAAILLSFLAGVVIILAGGVTSMIGSLIGGYHGQYGNMMSGYNGYVESGHIMNGLDFMGVLGVVFGVIVILSALMLDSRSKRHATWGVLIVIFSALSAFGGMMGGFGVGAILGIIGGILAITWKPPARLTPHS